jgi:DNA-binding NarL/FixJ family response regulator
LFGAADALLSISGIPLDTVDQIEYDRDLAEAKAQLDEGAWQSAWAEGYAMSLEQAIAYAQDDGASDEKNISPQRIVPAPNSRPTRSQIYPAGLTKREVQVLCLLTQGLTYEEIGEQLVISPRTVDTHLTNVYNKLGVDSRHQAALIATEHKLCE